MAKKKQEEVKTEKIEGNEPLLEDQGEKQEEVKTESGKTLQRNVFFDGKEMKKGTVLSSVPKELEPYVK